MTDVPVTRRAIRTDVNQLGAMPYQPVTAGSTVTHTVELPAMCPRSGNPAPGSTMTLRYQPADRTLEVVLLVDYVAAFVGGRVMPDGLEVLSMEQVPEVVARDAAAVLGVPVEVVADLVILPDQRMTVQALGLP